MTEPVVPETVAINASALAEEQWRVAGLVTAVGTRERWDALLGKHLGEEAREGGAGRACVLRVLEEHGFEPRDDEGAVTLGNCPFHALATRHTALVCGMNEHLLGGLVDAVPDAGLTARLRPTDGRCCVRLDPVEEDAGTA